MPATGLPDVKQKAIFDASGYVKGADETVVAAIKMAQANRDAVKSFEEMQRAQIGTAAVMAGSETGFSRLLGVQKTFDDLSDSVWRYNVRVNELKTVQEDFAAANQRAIELNHQQAQAFREAAEAQVWAAAQQIEAQRLASAEAAQVQVRYNAQMIEMANQHIAAQKALAEQVQITGQAHQKLVADVVPSALRNIDVIQSKIAGVNREIRVTEERVSAVANSSDMATIMNAFPQGGRNDFGTYNGTGDAGRGAGTTLGPILTEAIARGNKQSGSSRPATVDDLFPLSAGLIRADEESRRYSSIIPSLLAGGGIAAIMSLLGSPGVRSAMTGAAGAVGGAARAAGGAVGTAAGAVASVSGGAGAFEMGRAADESLRVGQFIGRNYAVAHWIMMATNELLATVGPATVALGMGGLVGMQGGEQVVPRALAIFDTAESLGDSLGITAGQAAGLKNSPLQTAQNLATGGAVEIAGAGINAIKDGAGDAFIQLGTNTVAMFDQFAAKLTQDFKGGLGKQLGSIVSGGTGYLQQFGDVLANVGDTFLHVAPNLPGAGGDILSVLQGATGALSGITGWAGAALGPVLSFEAGARYGPTLVGGAGRLLSRASFGTLGNVARTATADDIGTTLNPATGAVVGEEGEMIAGTGIAGMLGGMGAIRIGALAALAYTGTKAATWQDIAQQNAASTMQNINQMGFAQGVPNIISAMKAAGNVPDTSTGAMTAAQRGAQGMKAIETGAERLSPGDIFKGFTEATSGLGGIVSNIFGGASTTPSNYTVAQQQLQDLSKTMVNALGSGQQVATEWKKITGGTVDMGKAADIATMAQLQLGSAFEKNGKLTSTAKTMIDNLQAGYAAMNFTGVQGNKQFGNAVEVQTAMAGLQHSQISDVNSAYDQMLGVVTGGAANASGFFGALGGAPVTHKVGGLNFQAPPGYKNFAKALTSFTTASGAAAWNTLTNSQSGLIPLLGNQTDQLRVWQSMGALQPGQTTQMTAFQMKQLLPMMKNSPAGLSMLSTIGQEFGAPVMTGNQKQDYKNLADWTDKFAANAKTYNANMNAGSVASSKAPRDAQQYVQQIGSGVAGALADGITAHGADLQNKFMDSMIGTGGAGLSKSALKNYATFLANTGVPKAAGLDMSQDVAKYSGAGSNTAVQAAIKTAITQAYAKVTVTADTSQAKAAMNSLSGKVIKAQANVSGTEEVKALQGEINALRSKAVEAAAHAEGAAAVSALNGEIAALHSKEVSIIITTVNRVITQGIASGTAPGNPAPATLAGSGAPNMRIVRSQAGMKVPGYGGGDIFPAMLEPGELVVPKHLVGSVAPILSGRIPGFQSGGGFGVMGFETMLQQAFHGDAVQDTLRQVIWNIIGGEIPKIPQMPFGGGTGSGKNVPPVNTNVINIGTPVVRPSSPVGNKTGADFLSGGKAVSIEILKGIADGMKNATAAAKAAASALITKITQEMQYATGVSNAAAYGQGYDPTGKGSGIFGSMQLGTASPLTKAQLNSSPKGNAADYNAYVAAYAADTVNGSPAAQTVQQQMQSYLGTLKSFGKDIAKLRQAHLNKAVLAQLIAAGPTQGDQLAQGILGGKGGVKSVNQLWASIQKASKALGAQAAMAQYGGKVSPNLKSGTFITNNNVSVSVSLSAGSGGDLGSLSTKELNHLVALIQAALLKQAKRNRKTGIALPPKTA